jgi:RimJ/RimL family protein N-acetyltransferase
MYYEASLRNRQHLAEFESGNLLMQLEDHDMAEANVRRMHLDFLNRNSFYYGIFEKDFRQWVGQVYIGTGNWNLPEFTIGYIADVNHEGKGYISEAVKAVLQMLFEDAGAHRVRSSCNDRNVRSYRVMERCGLQREGHFRESKKHPDGTYHGEFHYAILRREFEERQKQDR